MALKSCIIGAGSSGLVVAKTLLENGVEFDWFEIGSGIGGNWRYNNDNGCSAAYDSLHIDTSKDRMAYADFPMPAAFPNYPHHSQVLEYFERYAKCFDLVSLVTFKTVVEHVEPLPDGGYKVSTENLDTGVKKTDTYGAVLVCNGHHWRPKMPDFSGEFNGEMLHSRNYRNPDNFKGKNVLILGVGNSGVDIACDVASVAANVFLASRRGAHVIPRHLLGRPTDKWTTPFISRFPFSVQRHLFSLVVWLSRGWQSSYGMPVPSTPILAEHPTLSTELLPLIKAGKVKPKTAVERFNGTEVIFVDGSREIVDVFICATGYQISFPFLDDNLVSVAENRVGLYGKVVHPDHLGLYFIGLIQPLGAIMPLAELQAKWVAGLITGRLSLPTRDEMLRLIIKDQALLAKRYVSSTRHTIQVDFFPCKRWLERQICRDSTRY
jgi:Flavin-binding monooxygenase-like